MVFMAINARNVRLQTSVLTIRKFTNLSADDFCILRAELTVTNGAPGIVDAQFHSATQWGAPTHQSQITSGAI